MKHYVITTRDDRIIGVFTAEDDHTAYCYWHDYLDHDLGYRQMTDDDREKIDFVKIIDK